jgi:hypothetical protein
MNPKIDELLRVLIDKGMSPDEVTKVRDELLSHSYEAFMTEALKSLTDEDLKAIEASATQEEANASLKRIYAEKTGKNSQEEMKRIVDEKATELIEKYKSVPAAQSSGDTGVRTEEAGIVKATDELHSISEQSASAEEDPTQTANPQNWQ